MSEKLKYGVIGDPGSAPDSLSQDLDLSPFTGETSGLNGVLIVGAGDVTREQLAAFLEAGLSVAVAGASPAVIAALHEITGFSESGLGPVAVYSASGGSHSFRLAIAVAPSSTRIEAPDEEGGDAPPPLAMEAPVAPESQRLLFEPAPHSLLRGPGDSFIPTSPGAAYGSDSSRLPLSGLINQPGDCDKHINEGRTTKQQFRGQSSLDLHCYWVDADSRPHYIVILKHSVYLNPAESGFTAQRTWTWDGWTKGYLLYTIDLEPASVTVSNGSVSLVNWAPKLPFSDVGHTPFSHAMNLRYHDGRGARSLTGVFTAEWDLTNSFFGWGCQPRPNPDSAKTAWRFHQTKCWNPTIHEPHKFPEWYSELYKYGSKHGYVRDDWPEQSITPLTVNAVSVWRIDCASKPGPKGAPVPAQPVKMDVAADVWARFALFHCREGCSVGHNHFFRLDCPSQYRKTVQLDQLCQPI